MCGMSSDICRCCIITCISCIHAMLCSYQIHLYTINIILSICCRLYNHIYSLKNNMLTYFQMSNVYNQPHVLHPSSLAHRAARDTGENGPHLDVCRWVKLVKGVIFGQSRVSLKSREISKLPFLNGGVAWLFLDLGRCISIHVSHKHSKHVANHRNYCMCCSKDKRSTIDQAFNFKSVAQLLHLGCVSNVNNHKILLKWWVLLNVSANWCFFFFRFLPHDQQTHNTTRSIRILKAFHLRVDHGSHMAPRNPLLEFQDIQHYIAIDRWPRWDSKGNWRVGGDSTVGRTYVRILKNVP